ncbi:tyrosine-type recombinase/integrase [Paraburkholderia domus]|uniref:tyrosine-type recombinase/integrase n=1 Tax=Paraburkholderia domus TaxID=2793075 RepID=UPI001B1EC58C|nr:tyrosine-type recombinase/integrase [Paraburkholderia domus]CAE6835062.1 Tyrosine recombinase XerC [Paraburkholderia domus]
MTISRLFRRAGVWHFRATVAGRRLQRSTKQKAKAAAAKVAAEMIEQAEREATGLPPLPTVRELARQWLETFENTHSTSHVRNVEICQRLHLGDLTHVRIDAVDTLMVERARDAFLRSHSVSTANAWTKNIRLLFAWAVRTGQIPSIPWKVVRLTPQKPVKTVLYAEQFAGWLAAIDAQGNAQLSTVVRLMLQLGLREAEVFSARFEWFDWHADTFTPGKTKGREAVPLPVVSSLRAYLHDRRRVSGLVVSRDDGRPLSAGWFSKQFELANRQAATPGITPHSLRRSFATRLHEEGATVGQISKLLRHKSLGVTEGYIVRRLLDPIEVMNRADQNLVHSMENLLRVTSQSSPVNAPVFSSGVGNDSQD